MKGICFAEPLFRAVIEGWKLQTRRPTFRYQPGEKIYPEEPYAFGCIQKGLEPVSTGKLLYRYGEDTGPDFASGDPAFGAWRGKQSMTEKHARCFIEITASRQEPLQAISDEDCAREGCLYSENGRFGFDQKTWYSSPREAYAELIDKIIKKGMIWMKRSSCIKKITMRSRMMNR